MVGFTNNAIAALPQQPANFTGDPLQVTQAFSGLLRNLYAWTAQVAGLLNRTFYQASQGGTQVIGTTAGDNATPGNVGEYQENITLIASEVNINAAANVAQLTSLPAGDWDVYAELWIDNATGAATLNGAQVVAITATSATLPTVPATSTARAQADATPLSSSAAAVLVNCNCAINLSSPATIYMVGRATVSAGNSFGYGKIYARRRR